jgi:hypothetical protein
MLPRNTLCRIPSFFPSFLACSSIRLLAFAARFFCINPKSHIGSFEHATDRYRIAFDDEYEGR